MKYVKEFHSQEQGASAINHAMLCSLEKGPTQGSLKKHST